MSDFFYFPKHSSQFQLISHRNQFSSVQQRCQDPKRNYFHRLEISWLRDLLRDLLRNLLVAAADAQVISKSVEATSEAATINTAVQASTVPCLGWNLC